MTALAVLAGYLIGSIPTGLLIIRWLRGVDIRTVGSGNIGATNVYRVAGLPVAILVLLIDALKGAGPVLVARTLAVPPWGEVLAGLAAIIGHNWSAFMRLAGGKGIATSFGVLAALSPAAAGVAVAAWLVIAALTRYASLASILAMATVPLTMGLRREPWEHLAFGGLALVFSSYRHRLNIVRLFAGTELKITDRAQNKTVRGVPRA
ncbi:MAG TPA: glycerol-3-phosphate 1-O-acyltransferase PlsY [bacterium]